MQKYRYLIRHHSSIILRFALHDIHPLFFVSHFMIKPYYIYPNILHHT